MSLRRLLPRSLVAAWPRRVGARPFVRVAPAFAGRFAAAFDFALGGCLVAATAASYATTPVQPLDAVITGLSHGREQRRSRTSACVGCSRRGLPESPPPSR